MSESVVRRWPFVLVVVFVCLAGYWAGAHGGRGAKERYHGLGGGFALRHDAGWLLDRNNLVESLGWANLRRNAYCGLAGTAAGAAWCLALIPWCVRRRPRRRRVALLAVLGGPIAGAFVGAACSLGIHAAFQAKIGSFSGDDLCTGWLLGAVLGGPVGLGCGVVLLIVAVASRHGRTARQVGRHEGAQA
jgi:hypothetical protein